MPDKPKSRGPKLQHRKSRRRHRGTSQPAATAFHDRNAQITITPRATPPTHKEPTTDYSYVYKDLRHIGIIVGGIVIVFIVLSFIWQ